MNGAVEFTREYRPDGDVFREAALEIVRAIEVARDTDEGYELVAAGAGPPRLE